VKVPAALFTGPLIVVLFPEVMPIPFCVTTEYVGGEV
jgi:hypothetical protein